MSKPCQEPNTSEIQELERKSKVLRCGSQLRKLGADAALVEQMVQHAFSAKPPENSISAEPQKTTPPEEAAESGKTEDAETGRTAQRPQACRGALGFRARQTREQYSVFKHLPDSRASQPTSKVKRKARAKHEGEPLLRDPKHGAKDKLTTHTNQKQKPSGPTP